MRCNAVVLQGERVHWLLCACKLNKWGTVKVVNPVWSTGATPLTSNLHKTNCRCLLFSARRQIQAAGFNDLQIHKFHKSVVAHAAEKVRSRDGSWLGLGVPWGPGSDILTR